MEGTVDATIHSLSSYRNCFGEPCYFFVQYKGSILANKLVEWLALQLTQKAPFEPIQINVPPDRVK